MDLTEIKLITAICLYKSRTTVINKGKFRAPKAKNYDVKRGK